jgi:subtilisin-like proprotein convertase family protein
MRKLLSVIAFAVAPGLAFAAWNASIGETNLNLPVPDNAPAGVSRSFVAYVPALGPVQDLQVRVRTVGGFNGDLYATLVHRDVAGRSGFAVLLNRVGRSAARPDGSAGSGVDVTFTIAGDDVHLAATNAPGALLSGAFSADGRFENPATVTEGTNSRVALLNSFTNVDLNGTWTLFVADVAGGATATLMDWSVDFDALPRPPILLPPDVVVAADPDQCHSTNVPLGAAVANVVFNAFSNNAPAQFPVGVTPVVWTLAATNGDIFTATQRVTVLDQQPPLAAAPADVLVNAPTGSCFASGVALGVPAVSDNCGVAAISNDAPAVFSVGVTLVNWTVTDTHGNSTTVRQRVNVFDTGFACPAFRGHLPVITEFMAANSSTLADEDGEFTDWIEIFNPGPFTINLLNWSLTDNASNLGKWKFPATNMVPGQYLVVFASNKNRRTPGRELHTSFRLDANPPEFLALVLPNGSTVASQFSPSFPAQLTDVSYGVVSQTRPVTLIESNFPLRVFVPADGSLGAAWTLPDFDDSSWRRGSNGVGFETGVSEVSAAAGQVFTAGPVGFWRLNESNSIVAANSGSGGPAHNGSYLNGVSQGNAGPRPAAFSGFETDNRAATFDGVDDKLDVPYSAALNTTDFTVSVWARCNGGAGAFRSPLTSRADSPTRGFIFYANNANRWSYWTGTGGGAGTWDVVDGPTVTNGQWVHLVGTQSGTNKAFYVNGALVASKAAAFSPNNASPLRIGGGASEGTGNFFFPGDVDEAAVFNRALSGTEVLQIFQAATNSAAVTATNFYYGGLIRTDVGASMLNSNSSVFIRIPFQVTNVAEVSDMALRMRYDDGFVAFINGQALVGVNAPETPAWNSTATAWRMNQPVLNAETFDVSDARSYLREGVNILAIHGLNYAVTNGDFLVHAGLTMGVVSATSTNFRYFTAATPGRPNGAGVTELGPAISSVSNAPALPAQPATNDTILVTARVLPTLAPVASVTLNWRVMFGAVQQAPMFDDGAHGDGGAGDGVFGASIPANVALAGQMIRWYVSAADNTNRTSRWPIFADPLNSPEYLGTVVTNPAVVSAIPVWEWFAPDYAASHNRTGTRGAVFFNGEFYDNVYVRQRGGFTAQIESQKFDFNTGHHIRINSEVGRVEEANLNGAGADASYMRPPVAFEVFKNAGAPASACFPLLLRYNGGADRVGNFIEQVDERFLDRMGFDREGALYKFTQRAALTPALSDTTDGVEKKTRLTENNADLQALVNALLLTNNIEARATFLFDNLDLAGVMNYLACRATVRDEDDVRKNFYLYRNTLGSGEWTLFPWDKDLALGLDADSGTNAPHPFLGDYAHRKPNANQWNMLWEAVFNDPRLRPMYLRRLRSLMDQQLGPVGYLEGRADSWFAPAFPLLGTGVSNSVNTLKLNIGQRRTELFVNYAATNVAAGINALIPAAQASNLVVLVGDVDFNPASGNQLEEFIQIVNTNAVAVDISGWKIDGGAEHRFRPGTVILASNVLYLARNAAAFRARVTGPHGGQQLFVQGNFNGSLSARGELITLTDATGRLVSSNGYAGAPTLAQQFLRVTEVMFNPPPHTNGLYDDQEFEFIELKNISAATSLDLTGVRFENGVSFNFSNSAITSLAPGAYVLIAENTNAFVLRYGGGLPLAGQYSGNLDNGGERIQVVDAVGEDVVDFNFDGGWHKAADGRGHSLVVNNVFAVEAAWSKKTNWLASACPPGSPGANEPVFPCDSDADGLPDRWELDYTTNLFVLTLAGDADGDGVPDLAEFSAGTDPLDASMPPRIAAVGYDAGGQAALVSFMAASNRTYTVQYRDLLEAGAWNTLVTVPTNGFSRTVIITNAPATNGMLFFRLQAE